MVKPGLYVRYAMRLAGGDEEAAFAAKMKTEVL